MGLVINDKVKMEWQDDRWVGKRGKGGKSDIFIMACKEYETEDGTVAVFFNGRSAWLHIDDEGTYSYSDLYGFVKDSYDSSFPEMYDEYNPLCKQGEDDFDVDLAEQYGLTPYIDDIKARLADLRSYMEVHDVEA